MHRLFPSQLPNEKICLVVREHWMFLLVRFLVVGFLFLALVLFHTYGPAVAPGLFTGTIGSIITLFSQLYLIGLVTAAFVVWVLYYLNVQIITDIRIVDIDQAGLFVRRISELHIDKIEDVTSETSGILGNILHYGNVFVQTAGTVERFEFERVPSPEKIEQIILSLYEVRPKSTESPNS